jgi:hypothetical protein
MQEVQRGGQKTPKEKTTGTLKNGTKQINQQP